MDNCLRDVASSVSIEMCGVYYGLGLDCIWNDGKDLTLVKQKNELTDGNLKSSQTKNILNKSVSQKTNESKEIKVGYCGACGRPLKSKLSIDRGFGPECYKKVRGTDIQAKAPIVDEVDKVVEQLEGQTFIDELRGVVNG